MGDTTFDARAVPCPWEAAPTLVAERFLQAAGFTYCAGLDEVGRGCLAGPVVAAAVILPLHPTIETDLAGVRDSKELTPPRRVALAERIRCHAIAWAIGSADVAAIDQHNILGATRLAMQQALSCCDPAPHALLLDALKLPQVALPQVPLIKGDQRSLSIAAASILAKVARDRMMVDLDQLYPGYDFARHKGYGTRQHVAALAQHGPCAAHRRSFAPIRVLLDSLLCQPPLIGTDDAAIPESH